MNNKMSTHRVFGFFGLEEASILTIFDKLILKRKGYAWEVFHQYPVIYVKISVKQDSNDFHNNMDEFSDELSDLAGPYLFSKNGETMEETVGALLIEKNLTISVAESCTGGRIGNLITDVSGSSVYFLGGVIVYSNKAKMDLLNVSERILKEFGAVSDPVAQEMAEGVRELFESDLGLAITGIAGPTGGSKEKPVGTVHIGLSTRDESFFKKYRFDGTRDRIKQHSSVMVLDWIRRYVNGDSFIPGI